jgi:hypothetical protein
MMNAAVLRRLLPSSLVVYSWPLFNLLQKTRLGLMWITTNTLAYYKIRNVFIVQVTVVYLPLYQHFYCIFQPKQASLRDQHTRALIFSENTLLVSYRQTML